MIWLAVEIALFLAIAALIGVAIGWALFRGKVADAPAARPADTEALKEAAQRIEQLKEQVVSLQSTASERESHVAQLRHQLDEAASYRVKTATELEQHQARVSALEAQLRKQDAELGDAPEGVDAAGSTPIIERDATIQRLKAELEQLNAAASPDAPKVAELQAEIVELKAILETGADAGAGTSEGELTRQLREEITGLKAAYEAAERSLEDAERDLEQQDGAIDKLTQDLLVAQQALARFRGDGGMIEVVPSTILAPSAVTPPPQVTGGVEFSNPEPAFEPLPVNLADIEDSQPAIVLPPPPMPAKGSDDTVMDVTLADVLSAAAAGAEPEEQDEATMAMPAFDLPDDDALERDEATMAMPAFVLPGEEDEVEAEAAVAIAATDLPDGGPPEPEPLVESSNGDAAATAADDLKKIRGIGPALEKRLNAAGIRTWRQLASLSESQIPGVADEIKVSPDKILKDGWIEQARALGAAR